MSLQFIELGKNSRELITASRQQKQLSYFTQSKIQEEVSMAYLEQWANRNYVGSDYFLDWVKSVFRSENFLTFFKYLRYPLPSAKLINDEIKPQLKRVYFSDDSYFRYVINGKEVEVPEPLGSKDFDDLLFNAILFNYNDIIVHDMDDVNSSYRELVCIDNVISIESEKNTIKKLCYSAEAIVNGEEVEGYLYLDDKSFIFYDKKLEKELLNIPHDLGFCPATWVSNESFDGKCDVVRKSMFSYVREELEEFVFLKTLLKMSEPNGAIPITVQLKTSDKPKDGQDTNRVNDMNPIAANMIGSQQSTAYADTKGSNSVLQTGTNVKVPLVKDNNGKVDMDIVQNFLKFFYIPTECLKYMNDRIQQLERSIIVNVLGDYLEMGDYAKNEFQVAKSFTNKQDKLRTLALNMSWTRERSDKALLGLAYGIKNINVEIFYGSDFFLDTENELYDKLEKAINPIERKNILIRLSKIKNRFNTDKAEREQILYSLLPFSSDFDYDKAVEGTLIDDITKLLQLKFDYWITLFEAEYGDILYFWRASQRNNNEKIIIITNILKNLIKKETDGKQSNSTPKTV